MLPGTGNSLVIPMPQQFPGTELLCVGPLLLCAQPSALLLL